MFLERAVVFRSFFCMRTCPCGTIDCLNSKRPMAIGSRSDAPFYNNSIFG